MMVFSNDMFIGNFGLGKKTLSVRSKQIIGDHNIQSHYQTLHSQKWVEFFAMISALVSKKRSNQQKLRNFIVLLGGFYFDSLTLLFLFDLFLEARAEILEKRWFFLGRFEDTKSTF